MAGGGRVDNVLAGIGRSPNLALTGITDPGYNAAGASYQIARFVFEIGSNNWFMSEPKLAAKSGISDPGYNPKTADPGYNNQFDRLQKKLVPLWKSIERLNQDPQ